MEFAIRRKGARMSCAGGENHTRTYLRSAFMTLTVTVAEDDLLVREGIAALISAEPGLSLLGACADLDSLLASVSADQPDVVLTDIRMPPTQTDEGIRAARSIRSDYPEVGVIVLSQYDSPAYALTLLEAGSERLGYLLKERVSDLPTLVAAIQTVANGGSVIDPQVVESLVIRQSARSPLRFLTDREIEVLSHMAQGKDNTAIGNSLYISTRAVEKHNNAIFAKLGLTEAEGVDKRVRAVLHFLDAQT